MWDDRAIMVFIAVVVMALAGVLAISYQQTFDRRIECMNAGGIYYRAKSVSGYSDVCLHPTAVIQPENWEKP